MAMNIKQGMNERFHQAKIMLLKNWKLAYRGWGTTAVELAAPVVCILILLILQQVPGAAKTDRYPETLDLRWKPCHGRTEDSNDCYPLFYTFVNNSDTQFHDIMGILARQNNYQISNSTDDKQLYVIYWPWADNSTYDSPPFYQYLKHNKNTTQAAVVFYEWGTRINYTLYYNSSDSCENPFIGCQDYRPIAQRAINTAILSYFQGSEDSVMNVTQTKYPVITPPNDAVKQYGMILFFIGSAFFFVILLFQIVSEKEHHLRQGLRMMGMRGTMYWLSWFIHSQIINVLSTLLIIAFGNMVQFAFFNKTSFPVLFILFYVFIFAMSHLAFLCATILPTTKQTIYVSMTVVVIGVLLCMIFSLFGFGLFPLLYNGSTIGTAFKYFLMFLPMYNFAKSIFDVNNASFQLGSASGKGYSWGDLYKTTQLNTDSSSPPTIDSVYYNLMLVAIFTVLAWYFDNVIAGHGSKEPFYFFLTPRYWGFSKPKIKYQPNALKELPEEKEGEHPSRELDTYFPRTGLQAYDLVKSYGGFCQRSVHALKNFSAEVDQNTILCLLGHNGAGKTTTINILTGLFESTAGDAYIYGQSVAADMENIRKIMGVCPQHDILWNELTAREHLQIFAELKGLTGAERNRVVEEKLDSVGLLSVGDKLVGGFSGGMKRRLSVAIACIGEPKIIFLDEPTTGMDPMSKRFVWDLIQQLKKNRVIILTTHSMEEADVLGDRIAIMSHGKIRCMGTPLHLKNEYGEGYRINVKANPNSIGEAKDFVAKYLPDSTLIAETAEFLVYGLPHTAIKQIPKFFRKLEKLRKEGGEEDQGDSIILDYGISHTTLEEVFLKVTREANQEENIATGRIPSFQGPPQHSQHRGPPPNYQGPPPNYQGPPPGYQGGYNQNMGPPPNYQGGPPPQKPTTRT